MDISKLEKGVVFRGEVTKGEHHMRVWILSNNITKKKAFEYILL